MKSDDELPAASGIVIGRRVWQRMQAGAFGWAENEGTGFKKTEKEGQKSKVLCPRLASNRVCVWISSE
jgi:hypothetical protein